MEWYNYTDNERISNVYSNFSLQQFWDWWRDTRQNRVMEIRIKDFNKIKEIASKYNLRYSASGIYVWTPEMMKAVMKETRKQTVWFGINSRKQNWNKWGTKSFGGMDYNINNIEYLFIDVDRIKKEGPANKVELENANKLCNIILERLGSQGWNKNYMKICSGNGVQLLIKLDIPLKLPNVEFDSQTNSYLPSEEFDKLRRIIPEGVGKDILKFCNNFKEELGVEVDKACFNIGRVGALPLTYNYKYDGFTTRGIVELKDEGLNEGFTDYIMSKEEDIKTYYSKAVFSTKVLDRKNRIKVGDIQLNPIIRLMLDNQLPYGSINNKLWFQLKCLLRDSKYDIKSKEFIEVHKQLEQKYKGNFTLNLPEERFTFEESIVNSYCFEHLIPPIYSVFSNRTKRLNMGLEKFKWEDKDVLQSNYKYTLSEKQDIMEDIRLFKNQLTEGNLSNEDKYAVFLNLCVQKYGEKITKYYFDYVMYKLLSYD